MRIRSTLLVPLLCVALTCVASCDRQSDLATSPQSASVTSAKAELQGDLKIVSYGPEGTEPGKAFNVQASGESALWVKLNRPTEGSAAAIWWGSHELVSSVSGDIVSALVPAPLYANAGRYPLQVRVKDGDASGTASTTVYFVVK